MWLSFQTPELSIQHQFVETVGSIVVWIVVVACGVGSTAVARVISTHGSVGMVEGSTVGSMPSAVTIGLTRVEVAATTWEDLIIVPEVSNTSRSFSLLSSATGGGRD